MPRSVRVVDAAPEPDVAVEAADVRAVWEPLGLPGLIDLHVHFMPQPVLAKVRQFFDDLGPGAWPILYRGDDQDRLGRLRAFGVKAFPSLLYPHKPAMAAWLNAWSLEFAQENADVLPTATFYAEPTAADYVAEALAAGARIFKSHVQVGAYDPRDAFLDPVWGMLADAGVPVVVHCGDGPSPGEFTGVGPFGEVMERHPSLTAVIAHLGMPRYEDFLELAERFGRVHLDTTMAFTSFAEATAPFPTELLPRLRDLGDRVLLGSDFPNIPHPYVHQLESIVGLGLGDDWVRGVLHDNAARLIALDRKDPA